MLNKIIYCSLLLLSVNLLTNCRHFGDSTKKKISLSDYFDGIKKDHGIAGANTSPIARVDAEADISAFFATIKPSSPKIKCLVDIENLSNLLTALKSVGADGIRLYSAAYTDRTAQYATIQLGMQVKKDDYHLIFVPIDKAGNEILSYGGLETIYNYNNDCPYSCPTDWSKLKLIGSVKPSDCFK